MRRYVFLVQGLDPTESNPHGDEIVRFDADNELHAWRQFSEWELEPERPENGKAWVLLVDSNVI